MTTLPSDYDSDDGWNSERGLEQCPHCELDYSGEGGYHGTVFDQNGRKHENFLDTNPGDGPFFCPDCWKELDANRKASENKNIGDYA